MSGLLNHPRGAALRILIIDCLRDGLERTAQISARINVPFPAVSSGLVYLRDTGVVTSEPDPACTRGAPPHLWHLVPAPGPGDIDAADRALQERRISRGQRRNDDRVIIRGAAYAPIGTRDPLVAALFGAPAAAPERNHP